MRQPFKVRAKSSGLTEHVESGRKSWSQGEILGYRTAGVSKIAQCLCKYIVFGMFDMFEMRV